jgi:hypothetical protein
MISCLALAFNILLSLPFSAELADTFARGLFEIPADTHTDLKLIFSLSIAGQIDCDTSGV